MGESPILAPDHVKGNAFTTLEDERVAIRSGGVLTPVAKLSENGARRVRGFPNAARREAFAVSPPHEVDWLS